MTLLDYTEFFFLSIHDKKNISQGKLNILRRKKLRIQKLFNDGAMPFGGQKGNIKKS